MILRFVRIDKKASAPRYGSLGAAGADVCSVENCIVPAKGLQVALPTGHYGRLASRSGLALNHSIAVGAGVIDADYRGEIKVLLFNFGAEDFQINVGDRVAQLICERFSKPMILEVLQLDETERGAAGFGSTGLN